MKNLTEEEKIKYDPFIRTDKGDLNLFELVFCVYFLMPIRFIGIFISLSTVLLVLNVCNMGIKKNQSPGKIRLFFMRFIQRVLCRFVIFFFGVIWIKKKKVYLKKDWKETPIIIANHIGHIDTFYL